MDKLTEYARQVPVVTGYEPELKRVTGYEPTVKRVRGYKPTVKKVLGHNPDLAAEPVVHQLVKSGFVMRAFTEAWDSNGGGPVTTSQVRQVLRSTGDELDVNKWLKSLKQQGVIVEIEKGRWMPVSTY